MVVSKSSSSTPLTMRASTMRNQTRVANRLLPTQNAILTVCMSDWTRHLLPCPKPELKLKQCHRLWRPPVVSRSTPPAVLTAPVRVLTTLICTIPKSFPNGKWPQLLITRLFPGTICNFLLRKTLENYLIFADMVPIRHSLRVGDCTVS